MSLSLIVVSLGAVVAAVGTGVLTARVVRAPRLYLAAWTLAIFGLAIALAAQAIGYLLHYNSPEFRAMELGAQVLAPLGLCLGLAELVGKSLPARFAMRLAVSAMATVAIVILAVDPLNAVVTFSKHWPNPANVYDLIPKSLIEYVLAPFTAATALVSVLVAMVRSRREQAARDAVTSVAAGATAAMAAALPGISWLLSRYVGASLPSPGGVFAAACLLSAALIWLAAELAVRRGVSPARAGARLPRGDADGWHGQDAGQDDRYQDDRYQSEDYQGYGASPGRTSGRYDDDEVGAAFAGAPYGSTVPHSQNGHDFASAGLPAGVHDDGAAYPALAALAAEAIDQPDEADRYRASSGQYSMADPYGMSDPFGDNGGNGHSGPHAGDAGYGAGRYGDGGPQAGLSPRADGPGSGQHRDRDQLPGRGGYPSQADGDAHARLFGQIGIYTLIEERIEEFDRLTERVVAQVRAREPDTLVYIVHAVPTAPMQRILYEVYRDRAAYEEHMQRPYVVRYEHERRPFVLAANVIEVGLQQAKVSPFPSITDILSESGVDLTGVTRPRPGALPPGGGYPPGPPPTSWPPGQPPTRQSASGTLPPGSLPRGPMAPDLMPPGSLPPGSLPPGSLPYGSLPPGSMAPGSLPPGSMPPGSLPPGSLPGGLTEPGYDGWADLRGEDHGYQ
jgi:quinol monooxygenase YgiN